jgi:SAM-dependent methyltransferase
MSNITPVSWLEERELIDAETCPACGSPSPQQIGSVTIPPNHLGCKVGLLEPNDRLRRDLCKRCGLIFLNPRYSDKTLEDFYREVCPANEAVVFPPDRHVNRCYARRERARWRRLYKLASRHAQGHKIRSALDVGALDGASLLPFIDSGAKAYVIEPGWESRTSAHPSIEAFDSIDAMANDGVQVDCLISTQTFEHLLRPGEFLRDCLRLLRPDGTLVIEVPFDLLSMGGVLNGQGATRLGHCQHLNFYTPTSLRRLARSAGLRVIRSMPGVEVHKYGGLHPSVTVVAAPEPELRNGDVATDPTIALEDLAAEVKQSRARVRALQRVYQVQGLFKGLGRW